MDEIKEINLLKDVYYTKEYISLYVTKGQELFEFEYSEGKNILINKTIKRPIKQIGNIQINDGFYDLETAYGYGGIYTNSNDKMFIDRALIEYEKKCSEENIIAEFMRFHPFNSFPITHKKYLDFNFKDREVVVVNLKNNILANYKSKVRNIVKKSSEKVVFKETDNIEKFKDIYYSTMKKNNADSFYFFDSYFFSKLLSHKAVKLYEIIFENETIAMGFFMFGDNIAHYHLSANTDISYKLNSNYALLNSVFYKAKELNIDYFLLGGGTSGDINDNLFRFKKKFSKETLPFYISGKIFNKEIYNKYNDIWHEQSKKDVRFFLKYRIDI